MKKIDADQPQVMTGLNQHPWPGEKMVRDGTSCGHASWYDIPNGDSRLSVRGKPAESMFSLISVKRNVVTAARPPLRLVKSTLALAMPPADEADEIQMTNSNIQRILMKRHR